MGLCGFTPLFSKSWGDSNQTMIENEGRPYSTLELNGIDEAKDYESRKNI